MVSKKAKKYIRQKDTESEPKSVSIKLLVEYAPHVTISADHTPVKESQPVTFTCNAHANPPDMSYRYVMNYLTLVLFSVSSVMEL